MSIEPTKNEMAQPVDPARLAVGHWCERANRTVSEGDIHASYSADRIGMDKPVRKPFEWRGALYVCVGTRQLKDKTPCAETYRLVPLRMFDSKATTYAEKLTNPDAARADPYGFYHGMKVKHAGKAFVLFGPPHNFIAEPKEQLTLF